MKMEIEGSKFSYSSLMESNSNLQVEINSLMSHVKIITQQNEELTRELDTFVASNEVIRQRLDCKSRVQEMRSRIDQ